MHYAIYDPDGQLIAFFRSDTDQLVPTQRQAASDYYAQFCSEFCIWREFDASLSIADIPEIL